MRYDDDQALNVSQVAAILGIGKTMVFDRIRTKEPKSFTIDRRRLVRGRGVRDYLDAAEGDR